ncbi:muscarinic acetylcholine receptor M3-like [Paramacrobiotus metropolitanus]|uniref:muscarinic acetylcholine receptor M3-like n=1 Tax=Paramacrobiotus metropolitanus TaxID=2943436 RepID=UPI002445F076|nr:muscarinic acetylcholine receptor M3-like [Paramacrobiotus metropolitanus]
MSETYYLHLNVSRFELSLNGSLGQSVNITNGSDPNAANIYPDISYSLLTVLLLIMIATVAGNGIVLIAFCASRRLKTPFNYYICNLALADFLVGIIAMPGFIVYNLFNEVWPAGTALCTIWMYFDWHMTFESAINLAAVSLDRYWSVRWPVSYKRHTSVKRTILILLATWLYMHIAFFPGYLYDRIVNVYGEHDCFWDLVMNRRFCTAVAVLGYYIPLSVMVFCNWSIGSMVVKRTNATAQDPDVAKKYAEGETRLTLAKDKARRQRQPLITLAMITVCAVICWAPWVIYFTIAPHYPTALPDILITVGYWMCYLNSTINPYLYIATSDDFRGAIRDLFCRRSGQTLSGAFSMIISAAPKRTSLETSVRRAS